MWWKLEEVWNEAADEDEDEVVECCECCCL